MEAIRRSSFILALATMLGIGLSWAGVTFVPDDQPIGYAAQPAVTNTNTASGNEYLYYADYNMADWSGNLHAVPLGTDGSLGNADAWGNGGGAAAVLDGQNYNTGRRIVTINSSTGAAVPFRWANLSTTQQSALGTATTGPAILNYLRGNTADDAPSGANYRARSTVLGDIIHSTPVHWKDSSGNATVFVNANDGMMHAFNAANGSERFAFVPAQVIPTLKNLTSTAYSVSHEYFVDGRLDLRNVTVSGSTKSILVGMLGAGGKGLFALDVTDVGSIGSETDAASRVMWEISSATTGYTNLGYTYGAPYIGTLESGTAAVIIANGYLGANGRAELFIINANTGAKIAEIDTGYGTTSAPNGLATPSVVDTDGDGLLDTAYAGDLDGHLFKFDLTNNTSRLLYTTSPAQPITTAPSVLPHPNGGYMVTFATGKILLDTDMSDASTFYAYGIWDGAPSGNTTLLSQMLTEATYTSGTTSIRVRYATSNQPNWAAGGHLGWKVALPIGGERVVADGARIVGNAYSFFSINPTVNKTGFPPYEDWWMQISAISGGNDGMMRLDLNGDRVVNDADAVTVGTATQIPVARDMGGGLRSQPIVLRTGSVDVYQSSYDRNIASGGSGVAGGHFDADMYYGSNDNHIHEYDDKYDVTGINWLNPSSAQQDLGTAIPNASTQFRILIANQAFNPGVYLNIDNAGYTNVRYLGTSSTLSVSSLPVYSQHTLRSLVMNLPYDAFNSKDWWGTGDIRAGVIPTVTGCVQKNTLGVSGTWRNGALTVQIISTSVTDSEIQLNVAGRPDLGWRLTATAAANSAKKLAEFTIFWHHPNGRCSNDADWIKNPPLDSAASSTKTTTPAAGSSDPTVSVSGTSGDGSGNGGGSGGGGTNTGTPVDSSGVVVGGSTDSTTMTEFLRGDAASTIGPGRMSWRVLQ